MLTIPYVCEAALFLKKRSYFYSLRKQRYVSLSQIVFLNEYFEMDLTVKASLEQNMLQIPKKLSRKTFCKRPRTIENFGKD